MDRKGSSMYGICGRCGKIITLMEAKIYSGVCGECHEKYFKSSFLYGDKLKSGEK